MFCFDTLSHIGSLGLERTCFDNHHPNTSIVFKVSHWMRSPGTLYRVKGSEDQGWRPWDTVSSGQKTQNLQGRLKTWVAIIPVCSGVRACSGCGAFSATAGTVPD